MTWTPPPPRRIVYRVPCQQCAAPVGEACRSRDNYTHSVRINAEIALTADRVAAVRAADPAGSIDGSEQLELDLPELPRLS